MAQRGPISQNNDFDTIITVVNFKSDGFVRSFSMRCQEAFDGYTTSGSENELQPQTSVLRGAPNRRRMTTSYKRNERFTWTEYKGRG